MASWATCALALVVLVQFVLLWQQAGREAACAVETSTLASHVEAVEHVLDRQPASQVRAQSAAARTAIYIVPTLMRSDDPEMWHVYSRHFASHAAYAHTHGYTLVLDTTNYVELKENRLHKPEAAGSSDFLAESNWPFALRAALNSRVRNASEFDYDWVYMADVDLMFVNDFSRSVAELFAEKFALFSSGSRVDIMVAQPFPHRRNGEAVAAYAYLVRNTPQMRWFADMYVDLLVGPDDVRCGPMTFGDQGYFHVALLKLIMRDRLQRGVPIVHTEDDDCHKRCRMPDIPGAELRKGSVQPQAPHEHERYALTLECFEFRSADLGLWRGHATFASQGPVAFTDVSNRLAINRSNEYEFFESGVGLNANWAAELSVSGPEHWNLLDAVAIHSKVYLATTAMADTKPNFVRAMRRLFGPVSMTSVRVLLRRMLASGVKVWRSTHFASDGPAEPSDPSAPLAPGIDRDLAELVLPTARLRKAKPVWHKLPQGAALVSIAVHDIAGTATAQLYRLLEEARTVQSVPTWADDDRGCPLDRTAARDPSSLCRAVHAVGLERNGPFWAAFWSNGARLPDDLPMPFPNALLEENLNKGSPFPPGAVWHFSMVTHPALRIARQWFADRDEQAAHGGKSADEQRNLLFTYAQKDGNRDVMADALTGCQTGSPERACHEHEQERLYHAKTVLRHSLTFFGIHEQWALSMKLLEATLRFGFGAPWLARDLHSGAAPPPSTYWTTRWWPQPPFESDAGWSVPHGELVRERNWTQEEQNGAYDRNAWKVWPMLLAYDTSLLQQLELLNPRDTALYRFATEEFARRLEFFEIPLDG